MVIGPDGMAVSAGDPPTATRTSDGERNITELVEQPAKVMRIGGMIRQLLEEVKSAPLDEASRDPAGRRSTSPRSRSSRPGWRPSWSRSSSGCRCRSARDTPSEAELRIAQAQLVGWLEGLFHGIQTAIYAQQVAARAQLEQMRRALPAGMMPDGTASMPRSPGQPAGRRARQPRRHVPLTPRTYSRSPTLD